jgi:hypothetical protein
MDRPGSVVSALASTLLGPETLGIVVPVGFTMPLPYLTLAKVLDDSRGFMASLKSILTISKRR